jgi:hypothetical protein
MHTHPNQWNNWSEAFSGGIDDEGKFEFGDATVPSIPGVNSIYVATPKGVIKKYSGGPFETVREVKYTETDNGNKVAEGWDFSKFGSQSVGKVKDSDGNLVKTE